MQATIKDNKLVITIELDKPRLSSSGKSMLVASETGKNVVKTADGKEVTIALNAYYKA